MYKIKRKVSNYLCYYRKLRGYKQKDVAKILEVYPSQISSWERGRIRPRLARVIELSIVYRRLPEDIFWKLFNKERKVIWAREKELISKDIEYPFLRR